MNAFQACVRLSIRIVNGTGRFSNVFARISSSLSTRPIVVIQCRIQKSKSVATAQNVTRSVSISTTMVSPMNAGVQKMKHVAETNQRNQSISHYSLLYQYHFISYIYINKLFREKTKSSRQNVELSMALLDSGNNRIVQDGSSVLAGDQVLIDIKTNKKGIDRNKIQSFQLLVANKKS